MRVPVLALLLAGCVGSQFRSTVPLVVAPIMVKDSRGNFVDVDASDLILYDNNVPRPTQADIAIYPISLVVAVETNQNSGAILGKLGNSGILFTNLMAGDQGETALVSFSDTAEEVVPFTSNSDVLKKQLKNLRPGGNRAVVLDGLSKALDILSHRKPGRRPVVLMIAESRDRSSSARLEEVVQKAQRLNVAVYWLTYSTTLSRYTDRKVKTVSETDKTPLPADTPPMDLLAPFTALAHLASPNVASLFSGLTGATTSSFLTKKGLETAIHQIGEEIHRQYILSFTPAPGMDGAFHKIRVEVRNRPELKATTRDGYWATW